MIMTGIAVWLVVVVGYLIFNAGCHKKHKEFKKMQNYNSSETNLDSEEEVENLI